MTIIETEVNSRRAILKRAAKIVRKSWGKHRLRDEVAPGVFRYCMLGAILAAEGKTRKFDNGTHSYTKAYKLIGYNEENDKYTTPFGWNDHLAINSEAVALALEEMAERNETWMDFCERRGYDSL